MRIRAGLCFLKDSGRQVFSVVCGEATDKHWISLHFLIRLVHSLSNCLKRNRYLLALSLRDARLKGTKNEELYLDFVGFYFLENRGRRMVFFVYGEKTEKLLMEIYVLMGLFRSLKN